MSNRLQQTSVTLAIVAAAALGGAFLTRQTLAVRADTTHKEQPEQVIQLGEAPEAVRAAFARAAPKGVVKKVVRETEDGAAVYGIEFVENGVEFEMTFAPAGDLIETERVVPAASLPEAVTKAVAARHPGAAVKQVRLVTETYYEVVVESAGISKEIEFNAAGGIDDDDAADKK